MIRDLLVSICFLKASSDSSESEYLRIPERLLVTYLLAWMVSPSYIVHWTHYRTKMTLRFLLKKALLSCNCQRILRLEVVISYVLHL
jgi:hypothetical protein